MSLKYFKPTTPSQRGRVALDLSPLKISREQKKEWKPILRFLRQGKKEKAGRNNQGRITVRHRGGGHKRNLRRVLLRRQPLLRLLAEVFPGHNFQAQVAHLVYDPQRSASLALMQLDLPQSSSMAEHSWLSKARAMGVYPHGPHQLWFQILAPRGLKVGDSIPLSGRRLSQWTPLALGESLAVEEVPLGTFVHNLEIEPGRGGQLARSAGCYAQVIENAASKQRVRLRLPSGEERWLLYGSEVSIGSVGNEERRHLVLAKAGRSRWLSRRPQVRGVAMNPVDHPHGGGEGKTSGGRPSVTPWGRPTRNWSAASKKKRRSPFRV